MSERKRERGRESESMCVPASHSGPSLSRLFLSPALFPPPWPVSTPLPSHAFPGLPRFFGAERGTESHSRLADTPPDFPAKEKTVSGERCEGEGEKKSAQSAGLSSAGLLHPPISGLPGVCVAIVTGD